MGSTQLKAKKKRELNHPTSFRLSDNVLSDAQMTGKGNLMWRSFFFNDNNILVYLQMQISLQNQEHAFSKLEKHAFNIYFFL